MCSKCIEGTPSLTSATSQPKERRKRTVSHDQSVRWSKRQFAVQDNAVEQVEIGASAGETVRISSYHILLGTLIQRGSIQKAAQILKSLEDGSDVPVALKKKEKQQLKREAFLDRKCLLI
jgi:ribosome biogenesis protein SLX9